MAGTPFKPSWMPLTTSKVLTKTGGLALLAIKIAFDVVPKNSSQVSDGEAKETKSWMKFAYNLASFMLHFVTN